MFNICDFVRCDLCLLTTIRKTSKGEHNSFVSKINLSTTLFKDRTTWFWEVTSEHNWIVYVVLHNILGKRFNV